MRYNVMHLKSIMLVYISQCSRDTALMYIEHWLSTWCFAFDSMLTASAHIILFHVWFNHYAIMHPTCFETVHLTSQLQGLVEVLSCSFSCSHLYTTSANWTLRRYTHTWPHESPWFSLFGKLAFHGSDAVACVGTGHCPIDQLLVWLLRCHLVTSAVMSSPGLLRLAQSSGNSHLLALCLVAWEDAGRVWSLCPSHMKS